MKQVMITKEEALTLKYSEYGITSGKRDKITGIRPTIYFCEELVFEKNINRSNKEYVNI